MSPKLLLSISLCICVRRPAPVSDWPWGHAVSVFTHHSPVDSIHIFICMHISSHMQTSDPHTQKQPLRHLNHRMYSQMLQLLLWHFHECVTYFAKNFCSSWKSAREAHNFKRWGENMTGNRVKKLRSFSSSPPGRLGMLVFLASLFTAT